MMDINLVEVLACPMCKGYPLECKIEEGDEDNILEGVLYCPVCKRSYLITQGVPVLLPDSVNNDLSSKDKRWEEWTCKIQNFVHWRHITWNCSSKANQLSREADNLRRSFVNFCELSNSSKKILDIGCGDGGIQRYLGENIYYIGIDPLIIGKSFRIVKSVGEYLPFRDGIFDEVIMIQILDHCQSVKDLIEEVCRVLSPNGAINIQQTVMTKKGVKYRIRTVIITLLKNIRHKERDVNPFDCKMCHLTKDMLIALLSDHFKDMKIRDLHSHVFIRGIYPLKK